MSEMIVPMLTAIAAAIVLTCWLDRYETRRQRELLARARGSAISKNQNFKRFGQLRAWGRP